MATEMDAPASTLQCFLRKPKPSPEHNPHVYRLYLIKHRFFLQLDRALLARWCAAHTPKAQRLPYDVHSTPLPSTSDIQAQCFEALHHLLATLHQDASDRDDLAAEINHVRRTQFGARTTLSIVHSFWSYNDQHPPLPNPSIANSRNGRDLLTQFSGPRLFDFFTWVQRNMYNEDVKDDVPLAVRCWETWLSESNVGKAWVSDTALQDRGGGQDWQSTLSTLRASGERIGKECYAQLSRAEKIKEGNEAGPKTRIATALESWWQNFKWVVSELNPLSKPIQKWVG